MKLGLFFRYERPPWQGSRVALKDAIDQTAYADAFGFDAVWIAEHHFSEYGVTPTSPCWRRPCSRASRGCGSARR